jgi:tripartite-type tricarboxylate transporter receptor subunit TctC
VAVRAFGAAIVIENRPGAGGNIAADAVVRAPADGYTLLVTAANNAINTTLSFSIYCVMQHRWLDIYHVRSCVG